jgi:hypothetical protein
LISGQGLEAVHAGHHQVEQHDVGVQRLGLLDASPAVRGFADDLEVLDLAQHQLDQLPELGVVVDDQDADAAISGPLGPGWPGRASWSAATSP